MRPYGPLPLFTRGIAVGALLLIGGSLTGVGALATAGWLVLAVPLLAALGLLIRRLLHTALWTVRRRLLASYVLVGLMPLLFASGLAFTSAYLFSGQLAVRRAEHELGYLLHRLEDVAELATLTMDRSVSEDSWDDLVADLDEIACAIEGAGIELAIGGRRLATGPWRDLAQLPATPPESRATGLAQHRDGRQFLFTWRSLPDNRRRHETRPADALLVYLPLDPYGLEYLQNKARVGLAFPREEIGYRIQTFALDLADGMVLKQYRAQAAGEPAAAPNAQGSPARVTISRRVKVEPPANAAGQGLLGRSVLGKSAVFWLRFAAFPTAVWSDPTDPDASVPIIDRDRGVPLVARTSIVREYLEVFDAFSRSQDNQRFSAEIVRALKGLGLLALAAYGIVSLLGVFLVLRIARATKLLHQGIQAVESRRFDFRLPRDTVGDQLSSLTQGFNHMVEHLEMGVAERAERKAIHRELTLAHDLQQSLLPETVQTDELRLAVDFQPAAAVGGDFYHFDTLRDGRLGVAVADVSGHGLAAGIVMAAAQSLLTALSLDERSTTQTLERLDELLRRRTDKRTFTTLTHCLFDPRQGRVEVTSAGHLFPYRVTVDGEVQSIGAPSRPLGLGLGGKLRATTVTADSKPGDLWVLISDGIVEAVDSEGRQFGFDRFEALLVHCAGQPAERAKDLLIEAQRRFSGGQPGNDDCTLLVIEHLH